MAVLLAVKASRGVEEILAESTLLVPPLICAVVANVTSDPGARLAIVHVYGAVEVQVHPDAAGPLTATVFVGNASV